MEFWNRQCYVEMRSAPGAAPQKIEGLDIKFNIRKNCYFVQDARIELLNPNRELQKQYLSHIGMLNETTDSERPITLYAGYESNGGAKPIFTGKVFSAFPSIAPDVWLTMNCMSRFLTDKNVKNVSLGAAQHKKLIAQGASSSITVKDIIERSIEALNQSLPQGEKKYTFTIDQGGSTTLFKKNVTSFTGATTPRDMLKELAALDDDLEMSIEDTSESYHVSFYDRTASHTKNQIGISMETGMIGLPKMNWPTVMVEVMMRDDIKLYQDIDLKVDGDQFVKKGADGMQFINGTYRVMSITYQGQLRQGRFSMMVELLVINEARRSKTEAKKTHQKLQVVNN